MGPTFNDFLKENQQKSLLRFTTAGSVDDGKSTLIGRLLYDSKKVFEDTLLSVKKSSQNNFNQGEIDFSLLTDGLRAEREQKITIDVAYRYFSTSKRNFILADTPGHEQYTRNMATGASTADAAIILIDARKGVLTQTKRHAFIASLLGVKHAVVAINKMDLVNYSQEVFENIKVEFTNFSKKLNLVDLNFIPVSALQGDNIVNQSKQMPWYNGQTILAFLETVYIEGDRNLIDLRFPVQLVIRPNLNFRGYAGKVLSGGIKKGDEVLILPSMKKTHVEGIHFFDGDLEQAQTPSCPTITLKDEIDLGRGDMIVHPNNIPKISNKLEAMLVWMDESPMNLNDKYYLKHTSRIVPGQIEQVRYRVDVNTLKKENTETLHINEIGRVRIELSQPIYHDAYERNRLTGSFIIIDRHTNYTVASGMILERQTEDDFRSNIYEQANIYLVQKKDKLQSQKEKLSQRRIHFIELSDEELSSTLLSVDTSKRLVSIIRIILKSNINVLLYLAENDSLRDVIKAEFLPERIKTDEEGTLNFLF